MTVLSHLFLNATVVRILNRDGDSEFGRVPGVNRHPSTMSLPGESLRSRGCSEITGARVGRSVIVSGVSPLLTETMPGSDCPVLPTLNEPSLSTLNNPSLNLIGDVESPVSPIPPAIPELSTLNLATAGLPFIQTTRNVMGRVSAGSH